MAEPVAASVAESPADPGRQLRVVPFSHADVATLVAEVQAEYVTIYGSADDTPLAGDEFDPPSGALLLVYDENERAVAMGGWRFRPDVETLGSRRAAEIKRMYVVPAQRGSGLAQFMLAGLEAHALAAGADVMVLETGLPQAAAVALYRRAGYVDAGARFGHYADSEHAIYLAKRLVDSP